MRTDAVLRYRDGRIVNATIDALDAAADGVQLSESGENASRIAFDQLKAVFFPRTVPEEALEEPAGSVVTVEFRDGEVIRGTAQLNPEKQGFFLYPMDRSKNDRIFVVSAAVNSIAVEKL